MLSTVVTTEMCNGVFTEVMSLVPIVLPAVVSFIAFRKGWSFIRGAIQGA